MDLFKSEKWLFIMCIIYANLFIFQIFAWLVITIGPLSFDYVFSGLHEFKVPYQFFVPFFFFSYLKRLNKLEES